MSRHFCLDTLTLISLLSYQPEVSEALKHSRSLSPTRTVLAHLALFLSRSKSGERHEASLDVYSQVSDEALTVKTFFIRSRFVHFPFF